MDFKCEKCKIIFGFFFLRVNSLIKHYPDIVDIKPANMEELTEVITAAEFHPNSCNTFVYSSSKGTIRLCDMRASALCDRHSKCKFISLKMTVSRKLTSAFTDKTPSLYLGHHMVFHWKTVVKFSCGVFLLVSENRFLIELFSTYFSFFRSSFFFLLYFKLPRNIQRLH